VHYCISIQSYFKTITGISLIPNLVLRLLFVTNKIWVKCISHLLRFAHTSHELFLKSKCQQVHCDWFIHLNPTQTYGLTVRKTSSSSGRCSADMDEGRWSRIQTTEGQVVLKITATPGDYVWREDALVRKRRIAESIGLEAADSTSAQDRPWQIDSEPTCMAPEASLPCSRRVVSPLELVCCN
jgi:hypothetical protein